MLRGSARTEGRLFVLSGDGLQGRKFKKKKKRRTSELSWKLGRQMKLQSTEVLRAEQGGKQRTKRV